MAKMTETAKGKVEEKVGQCRTLARSIRDEMDRHVMLSPGLRRIANRWADDLDEIAIELTKAMAEGDRFTVRKLLWFAGGVATLIGAAADASALKHELFPEHTIECAQTLHHGLNELDALVALEPITGTADITLQDDTMEAHGTMGEASGQAFNASARVAENHTTVAQVAEATFSGVPGVSSVGGPPTVGVAPEDAPPGIAPTVPPGQGKTWQGAPAGPKADQASGSFALGESALGEGPLG